MLSSKLVKGATLKVYKGAPHGMCTTQKDDVNGAAGDPEIANDGQDTRALQHYLGHKYIQHTVGYTELSADRFKSFWED